MRTKYVVVMAERYLLIEHLGLIVDHVSDLGRYTEEVEGAGGLVGFCIACCIGTIRAQLVGVFTGVLIRTLCILLVAMARVFLKVSSGVVALTTSLKVIIALVAVVAVVVVVVLVLVTVIAIVASVVLRNSVDRWFARVTTLPVDHQRPRATAVTRQGAIDWFVAHHEDFELCELLEGGEVLERSSEIPPAFASVALERVAVQVDVDGHGVQVWRLRAPKREIPYETTEAPVHFKPQERVASVFNDCV